MIPRALGKLLDGQHLTTEEAGQVMTHIMQGGATQAQIGALLGSLRTKKETTDELVGFATAMREHAIKVTPRKRPLLDTCGTGGDGGKTFNISTCAAFVIAASGIAIAKHGNRGVSSNCGSADVLAALGVDLSLSPEAIAKCIDKVGIGFMYAPTHHPATGYAAQARKEMGVRTAFNLLGPLVNPAGATRQLVGVFDPDMCEKVAETLGRLGCERAMVVHGMDGLDEISTIGPTRIAHLQQGRVSIETRIPAEFFVVPSNIEDIKGGDTADENADIIVNILQGEAGPKRDIVCVNAAAGLILGGMAEGWRDGLNLAYRLIDSKKAINVLQKLVDFTTDPENSAQQAAAQQQ